MRNPKLHLEGHTWTPGVSVRPALVSAIYSVRRPWVSQRNVHPSHWVLDYSLTDSGLCRVGSARSRWLKRTARIAHLYAPGTPYWEDARPAGRAYCRETFVTFLGPRGSRADRDALGLRALARGERGFRRFLDPDGCLGTLLLQAARVGGERGDEGFCRAQAILFEALDLLRRGEVGADGVVRLAAEPARPVDSEFVRSVRAFLREKLSERVTLARIARHVHLSVSSLSHRFRLETGEPPMRTLSRMRINLAKGLLLKGETLQAIAERTGFGDAFHLSKSFKKSEGVSPRDYRKSLRRRTRPPGGGNGAGG